MEVVITTIIAASGAIVAAIIAAIISSRATNSLVKENKIKIDTSEESLSKEHDGLSKEHGGLSKEHQAISKYIEKVEAIVADTNKIMLTEKTKQEFRYNNLTDKQKDISQSITAIELMHSEMKRLQSEQSSLYSKIASLTLENEKLQAALLNEKKHSSNLMHQLDEDERER